MAILADTNTKILIQGITGREASMVTKHTLDYGTKIIAGVTPGKGGQEVHGVPVYDTVKQACSGSKLNAAIIYVPPAFAYDAALEAMENGIKLILIMTERIKVERCFVPGPVGVISRSGGMTAECSWMVKRAGYGVTTSVSIGGDALIGSPPKKILSLFEKDHNTKAVVMWSEPGTNFEEEIADFINEGEFTKTLIIYVAGKFVEEMPEGTVFGHAASIIQGDTGRPSKKINALKQAGAYVAESFNDVITFVQEVMK